MKDSAQSLPDKILWILSDHSRRMKQSELRRHIRVRMHELNPILENLEKEGRIQSSPKEDYIFP